MTVGLELGLEEEGRCEDTPEEGMGRHKACFGGKCVNWFGERVWLDDR